MHHAVVGSTNDLAKVLAANGLERPLLVSADRQTDGRGREGRKWASPLGGAWMTLAWPVPTNAPDDHVRVTTAPLVVGLAVVDAIDAVMRAAMPTYDPSSVRIKWPNDVLLAGKKIAGVLCERELRPGDKNHTSPLMVGVGINVNNSAHETAQDLGDNPRVPATSLAEYTKASIEPAAVIEAFAERVGALLGLLGTGGLTPELCAAIESRMAFIGGPPVRIGDTFGVVQGIDATGRVRVRTNDGTERAFASGELRFGDGALGLSTG